MTARRAITRWAVRLFRREWRQQILVIALLTVAVTGATFGVAATYNLPSSSDATFGSADHLMKFDGLDPATLDARLSAARSWFGTTEAIGHRYAKVPGLFDPVDIRAQDPAGPYGTPMLALRQGRYPTGGDEIALTERVARILHTGVGAQATLDGRTWQVVGTVENPNRLTDPFALVAGAHADPPQSVTVLVSGSRARLDAFRETIEGPLARESRPASDRTVIALATEALAAIGLLLVSLVAAAGFVVVAQRRMRQLGMLAAMGATRRHLQLVMLVNGTLVGAVAAVLGTLAGLAVWLAAAGTIEPAAGHRIDRFDLPWAVIAAGIALAVLTATAAAWWPARTMARVPIVSALSARPPRPRPAHRSIVLAAVLLAAGVAALVGSDGTRPALIIAGAVTTAAGMLFLGPQAIRALAAARRPMPVAVRLALTDLIRYQARAGAALAAISLASGITVAIVAGSAAAEYTQRQAAGLGNLSDGQLIVHIGAADSVAPDRTPAQLAQLNGQLDTITAALDGPAVVPLQQAVVSAATAPGDGAGSGHPIVEVGVPNGDSRFASYPLHVATPELLRLYGVDAGTVAADVDVLTVRTEQFQLVNIPERAVQPTTQRLTTTGYTSVPDTLITPAAMARHGWAPALTGWFLDAHRPLTSQELDRVQALAADAGLTVEPRREQASLSSVRTGATAIGILLCLGVLATTVGLIRGEGANDLRTLTATGAPRRVRRTLTASTAGGLALLGVLLGAAGAYASLAGVLHRHLAALSTVPAAHLATVVVGLPLLATVAGWLVTGRQPPSFARRRLD